MKKNALLLLSCFLILSISSCVQIASSGYMDIYTLPIGLEIDEYMNSGGTHYYRLDITHLGYYTVSLTDLNSDFGWTLYHYVSDYFHDYTAADHIITTDLNYGTWGDEIDTIFLDPGQYLLIIDELGYYDSWYTLWVG